MDVAHQLNPVDAGLSLFLPRSRVPLLLGPYVPLWPPGAIGLRDTPRQRLLGPPVNGLRNAFAALQQRRATMLLLSTPAARERLKSPGRAAVRELPYGIDVNAFGEGVEDGGQDDGPILFLAGLEPWKGIHTLLDAFEMAAGDLGERRLVIAGDGSLGASVRARVAASPVGGRIDVLGRVERDRVPGLLGAAALYCLPSVREPFGISALEAMACGLPVVATDAGGVRHLVGEEGGRLVPPGRCRGAGRRAARAGGVARAAPGHGCPQPAAGSRALHVGSGGGAPRGSLPGGDSAEAVGRQPLQNTVGVKRGPALA